MKARPPRAPQLDSILAFRREGYRFIGNMCDRLQSDIFTCRLLFRRATVICGPDAAEAFYMPGRLTRNGAIPRAAAALLQGPGSVHALDSAAHHRRKAMFMNILSHDSIARALAIFNAEWEQAFGEEGRVMLLEEASSIMCRTAMGWCGLDPEAHDADERTAEFMAMIRGAGSGGWAQVKGRILRRHSERWAAQAIRNERMSSGRGRLAPARMIALARDAEGVLLPESVAAVELVNLLRPFTAVARFAVFAAHALHLHPRWRQPLLEDVAARLAFAQEVRRFYPLVPAVAGIVRNTFAWAGHRFAPGQWVILDIYGTNHHPVWGDPDSFQPERFLEEPGLMQRIAAQGSGDPALDHRCPGEDLTVALIMEAARLLASLTYEVPEQDLSIPLNCLPTAPRSGFVMML